ncbi:MAG: glycosyltransferase family 39 protein [Flavobacteriales bacterium]|jgi:4-amino-4-deoxy-L-arabinose transferase-like glycosyltransferase|nr:glycosyltransferase family 39 protein [Flavobacteriales bacterium]
MSDRSVLIALLALVTVVAMGAVLDVMQVDAAQYAAMSREMLHGSDWGHLHHRGQDYLDKPPLLFWLSALSYKVFGVHAWSYRLPSMLFAFIGLYATHRFARLFHPEAVARTAALMYGSCAAFILMNGDVKTDTMLTASAITATWLGMAWVQGRRMVHLAGCAVAIALGMLAKGPMGLMAPAIAIGGHVLWARRFDVLRRRELLLAPAIVGLLLLPMAMGLYDQHGAHGLRFFFWEQSFGRITGENRWKDDSTVLFFTHEVIWQLLPWTLFTLLGLWQGAVALVKRRPLPEHASWAGAVLVTVALSFSQFKLPHYLYVVVPLYAVLAARAWHAAPAPAWRRAHGVLVALLWTLAMVVTAWSFPQGAWPFVALLVVAGLAAVLHLRRGGGAFAATFTVMIAAMVALNGHIYPSILRYQANAQAGKWAAAQGLGPDRFIGFRQGGTALDFYAGHPVRWYGDAEEVKAAVRPGTAVYTTPEHAHELSGAGLEPRRTLHLDNYPVQLLSLDFLHPGMRENVLEKRVVLVY